MSSFSENMVGLIVGLERGVLPKLETLEDLLDKVTETRSEDTAKMGPDLWHLCIKLDKELESIANTTGNFTQIYCALHLLVFRLYQVENETMDMQSGLTIFIVALRSLGQLIKYHWTQPSTVFSKKIWSSKTYDDLLSCLSTVFKLVLQPSFLFKSGSPELLQQIFIYHIVELKFLFIQVYESRDSNVLLDRLAYAASFYRKSDQQDAIINLILDGIAILPYRQSLYKTNVSFIDRILRILKQMFELKAASKHSLANILRTFADVSILTRLMNTPISIGYSIDFCITKSQELCPWPLADAILKVKHTVQHLVTSKPAPSHIESCQQIDSSIQTTIDTCSHTQDVANVMFTGLSNILSFLAENGFLSSTIRAAKNIIDRTLTGLLIFREETAETNLPPFRSTQPKDGKYATRAPENNQLYATKIVLLVLDIVILTESTIDRQELISVLPTLESIFRIYIDDSNMDYHRELKAMLHDRSFYLLTALISRGDIPCQQLLKLAHSIKSNPRSVILVVQHALIEIETLCGRIRGSFQGSSSSFPTPSQDSGNTIKELSANLIGQSTSLLRDIQQYFTDKSIPSNILAKEHGVTRYEFYYLFINVLVYGQDIDSAIQLTKHVITLLEVDEDLQLFDFKVLTAIMGLYITCQHNVGGPVVSPSTVVTSVLITMLLALTKRYLSLYALHNKYLKLLIEYSIELVHELIQLESQIPEGSSKMFSQAREVIELYIDKVGIGRLMPHELDTIQCALYKLFMAVQSSLINKDRKGDTPVAVYDVIVLYRILIELTTAIEEREPPVKRSFFTIHREGSQSLVDPSYLPVSSQRHGSQSMQFTALSFTEANINLSVGLVLYTADFNRHATSILKQNTFVGLICQQVLSWTGIIDKQLDITVSMLSALGNYFSIISEGVVSDYEQLPVRTVRCTSQAFTFIPISDIFKLIGRLQQENNATTLQVFTSEIPLTQILFHYSVLLVLITAKVSLIKKDKCNGVFLAIMATMECTEHLEFLSKLIEYTLRLSFEIDCGPVIDLLLERYKSLDPVSCTYTYVTTSSRIETNTLVVLLTAVAEAGEKDPKVLVNEKMHQLISRLNKGPVQNTALSQLLARLKTE
ncbi:Hypothetical protein GLP15_4774 [Giardia lamblia P15]|uniref:Uncharacterized protein n=1 Tax=Giardia intestinalis (strain P15) TaxID=658858 RepID=E1F4J0_GIAIA|nr:Hypothetical protein GLP15_4774 [Giardia lamblia P15]